MGHIRTIKPVFFVDERLGELPPIYRLIYIGLWTQADREGRLEDRPQRLKVQLCPFDRANVDQILSTLHEKGFVRRYEIEGKKYLEIPSFLRHQKPHHTEKPSLIPPLNGISNGELPVNSPVATGSFTYYKEREGKGRERKGRRSSQNLEKTDSSKISSDSRESNPPAEAGLSPEELAEAWNEVCPPLGLAKVLDVRGSRRKKAQERIRERPSIDFWREVFAKISRSRFLLGKVNGSTDKTWKVNFDFLIANDVNATKIAEGRYDG